MRLGSALTAEMTITKDPLMTLKHPSITMLIALLASLSGHVFGQTISGTIVGTVHDASGAVVIGTRVTATSISTGISQITTSGADGDYTISNLPPGDYKSLLR